MQIFAALRFDQSMERTTSNLAVNDEAWIGLENPRSVECNSVSDCSFILKWSDGSQFTGEGTLPGPIRASGQTGFIFVGDENDRLIDVGSGRTEDAVCELTCPRGELGLCACFLFSVKKLIKDCQGTGARRLRSFLSFVGSFPTV